MKLDVDALLEAAVAKAKSDAFGDMWFLEPLNVLVDALNTEAQLNEIGFAYSQHRLTSLLVDRLRWRATDVRRLVRAYETLELAARLHAKGGRAWEYYERLLACERGEP